VENLAYGTPAENQADRVAHGTSNRGRRQWQNRLTEDQVHEIRRLRSEGFMQKEIAERFGIARTTVSGIANGHQWAWLKMK
jgi:DNA invertase Pin-like site-specific DNA recombinase